MMYFPMMSYTLSLLMYFLSMILMMTNMSLIMEWEITLMLSSSMKMDTILEWSGMMYSSTVMFISGCVLKFSNSYMMNDLNKQRFTYIVILFITSMNLLIFIPNLMCLLIGWDGLGITSFILVVYYNNPRSMSAGMLTILTNRLGDVFLLMAITYTLNSGDWLITHNLSNNMFPQYLGILTAAMTKSAQLPYSSWLPAAMAAPTPVSALVHSSTLVTAGIFMLYRFNNLITHSTMMKNSLVTAGISTMLLTGTSAIYESDMKKIIALSTLSQLGLMTLLLGMGLPLLAFFHMTSHALFKALLFITAGNLITMNNHNQDLRLFGQSSYLSPITSSSLFISTAALIGLPFTVGYYSKHAIMQWSYNIYTNYTLYSLMLLAIMLTTCYTMRLLLYLLTAPLMQKPMYYHATFHNFNLPMLIMSTTSIFIGSALQWMAPLPYLHPLMTENCQPPINFAILTGLMVVFTNSMNTVTMTHMKTSINQSLVSMSFSTNITSQLLPLIFTNVSLYLHKHLDQSWLEKLYYIGPSNLMISTSTYLNFSLPSAPQTNLLNMATASTAIFILHYYCN